MAGRVRSKKPPHAQPQGRAPSGQHGASASVLLQGTDTALRLLQDIKAHRMDPRDLSPTQRRACLMLLANGTQTSAELAAMFRTSPSTIRMDLKRIRDEVGREVRDWTLSEVVGQLALTAEKCTAHAMKNEDPGLAWTVQRDFAKLLRELGVIQPHQPQSGFRMIVEQIGDGYDRARQALQLAINPTLTGDQADEHAVPQTDPIKPLTLPARISATSDPSPASAVPQTSTQPLPAPGEHAVPQTDQPSPPNPASAVPQNAQPRAQPRAQPGATLPGAAMGYE